MFETRIKDEVSLSRWGDNTFIAIVNGLSTSEKAYSDYALDDWQQIKSLIAQLEAKRDCLSVQFRDKAVEKKELLDYLNGKATVSLKSEKPRAWTTQVNPDGAAADLLLGRLGWLRDHCKKELPSDVLDFLNRTILSIDFTMESNRELMKGFMKGVLIYLSHRYPNDKSSFLSGIVKKANPARDEIKRLLAVYEIKSDVVESTSDEQCLKSMREAISLLGQAKATSQSVRAKK